MAAPSGTVWGSTVGGYGKIGIYTKFTDTATTRKVEIEVWFASKYSVSDSNNTLYYNRRLKNKEASTSVRTGSIYISKNHDDGAGWNAANAVKLWSDSHTYTLQTSSSTIYLAAKLANVDRVGGTMKVSRSFTVPALASYTISYDLNGGSGTFNAQTKYYGNAITLRSGSPTRTGYSFLGWSTSKTATSATYSAGGTLPANTNANTILYAVWRENTYTITFNANGGSGGPTLATKHYTRALTLPTEIPTRTNYDFLGWSTSKTATSATYSAGGTFTTNSATTLYAVWKLAYVKPKITKVSVDRCAPKTVTNYIYTKTDVVLESFSDADVIITYVMTDDILELSETGESLGATTTTGEQVYSYTDSNSETAYYCVKDNKKYIVTVISTVNDAIITPLESYTTTGERVYSYTIGQNNISYYCIIKDTKYAVTVNSVTDNVLDEDGNPVYKYTDEGMSAFVSFVVNCWGDETIQSIKIDWAGSNGESGNIEEQISEKNFDGSVLIGDNNLDLEAVYTITITVTDTTDSNSVNITLEGLKVAIDSLPGNRGVSFGKPAELEDHADFNFTIYPRKGYKTVTIEKYTDFNNLIVPNTYVSEDGANSTYVNCPITSGTFKMEVSDGGLQGQVQQTITYTNKTDFKIYHRHYHSGSWPTDSSGNYVWKCVYSVAGNLLWSGAWYMNENQCINLPQKISDQPHGITLVFSLYDRTKKKGVNEQIIDYSISKRSVALMPGSGHSIPLFTPWANGVKYLYVGDTTIEGNTKNDKNFSVGGISYTNMSFVLRYVIGF